MLYLSKKMSLQFTESDCRIFSSSFNYLLSVPFCKEFSNQLSCLTKAQITPDLCFYHLSTHKIENRKRFGRMSLPFIYFMSQTPEGWMLWSRGKLRTVKSKKLWCSSVHACYTSIMSHVDGSKSFNSICRAAISWNWLSTWLWLSHYTLSISAIVLMY